MEDQCWLKQYIISAEHKYLVCTIPNITQSSTRKEESTMTNPLLTLSVLLYFYATLDWVDSAQLVRKVKQPDKYVICHDYKAKAYNYRQRFLVMHYTVSNLPRSIKILTGNRVSSHYLVPETPINGTRKIYQLVDENLRAWTQGVSQWKSRSNLNDQGIGVEIVNGGFVENKTTGIRVFFPFTDYQIESVIGLALDIIARYEIQATDVIGHADIAPDRKEDPGPLFPWKRLYEHGIGAWPDDKDVAMFQKQLPDKIQTGDFQRDLRKYGYPVNTDGVYTWQTKRAVQAFQMHFRQSKYDGVIDKETYAVLKALLKKYLWSVDKKNGRFLFFFLYYISLIFFSISFS